MSKTELSWKPVRRGAIYCAPACGASCTWVDYQRALAAGTKLQQRIGDPFVLRVWENMGWFYCIETGSHDKGCHITIHSPMLGSDTYCVIINPSPPGIIVRDKNPKIALRQAMVEYRQYVDEVNDSYMHAARWCYESACA